jgi:hypothetical protein
MKARRFAISNARISELQVEQDGLLKISTRSRYFERDDGVIFDPDFENEDGIFPNAIKNWTVNILCWRLRMDFLPPKNFKTINIADANNDRLIHQQLANRCFAFRNAFPTEDRICTSSVSCAALKHRINSR